MKRMKKLASILLAAALAVSMAAGALAVDDPTYTITINNATSGHT